MKAKKITVGMINFVIFAGMVGLGAGSGYYTGNYRIGIHIGMALGLMGIAVFRLWREKIHASLKDATIPQQAESALMIGEPTVNKRDQVHSTFQVIHIPSE